MMKDELNDPIPALMESVKTQDSQIVEDISEKLKQKKYRQVFLLFTELKESGKWKLNETDEKNLEKFWWEYAN